MKKFIVALFCYGFVFSNCAIAATYTIDKRQYVDWSAPEFQKIVKIELLARSCTGQYVSPNIILTAAHCLYYYSAQPSRFLEVRNYKGDVFPIRVIMAYNDFEGMGRKQEDNDWALLLVEDPAYYARNYFNIARQGRIGAVQQVGFGALRILSDEEIHKIRKKLLERVKLSKNERNLLKSGEPEKEQIVINDYRALNNRQWERFLNELDNANKPESEGGLGIPELFNNDRDLKSNASCSIVSADGFIATHTCMTYGGDSGSALWAGQNELLGVAVKSNPRTSALIGGEFGHGQDSVAIDSKQFYNALQQAIQKYPVKNNNEQ
ncbi:MAG: trypsin-like serine protease [Alphaproteobacteria bacterium]|nr:trypsin-like serine protease [Alphaproteobacteria bacterium]